MRKSWWPDTLFARLAWLLALAVVASQVLVFSVLFRVVPVGPPRSAQPPPADAAMMPPPERPDATGHLDRPPPRPGHGPDAFKGDRPLQDPGPPGLHWSPGMVLDVGLRIGLLLVAAWVAAKWLSRPLRNMAQAARELGLHLDRPPLLEEGPLECREAARVFNQMQQRIRQQLAERERFLAAVSHDLRTPLTRMRLRAENLPQGELQTALRKDIADMQALIDATLDYLNGREGAETLSRVDVQALLESLSDDLVDMGEQVTLKADVKPISGQPVALRRCLDNVVGNALRYGAGQVAVSAWDTPDSLVIQVLDNGPGLPEAELTRVTEPYYRVDASRHKAQGGVGLGLAIAKDVVQRHGGQLLLANAPGGGLKVTLQFPRSAGH